MQQKQSSILCLPTSLVVASSANLLEKECTEFSEFSYLKKCSGIKLLHESKNIETGEKSIETPPFSPLTPLLTKNQTNIETGEKSIEAPPFSLLTPLLTNKRFVAGLPTSPAIAISSGDGLKINYAIAISGYSLKINDAILACESNCSASAASSPLPPMSPETAELFKTLNGPGLDYDSDDSVADPNYTAINDNSSSSSRDSKNNLNREQRNNIEINENQNVLNNEPIAEVMTINDIASTSTDNHIEG